MIGYVAPEVFYGLVIACIIGCFFVGHAMDGVIGSSGFGVLGNMLVLTTGLFLGIFLADIAGLAVSNVEVMAGAGLVGAFSSLLVLVLLKHLFMRVE
ncbi:MAG: hypothetical protein NXI27_26555 [Alphaproteobacteria bacterium]|nr:hypothetical protein [Alphaproteobacteria bacterium]